MPVDGDPMPDLKVLQGPARHLVEIMKDAERGVCAVAIGINPRSRTALPCDRPVSR